MTIEEEKTYLQTEISETQEKIAKTRHLKSTEEGGSSSRFSAQYTELDKLRKDERELKARLGTLQGYSV